MEYLFIGLILLILLGFVIARHMVLEQAENKTAQRIADRIARREGTDPREK